MEEFDRRHDETARNPQRRPVLAVAAGRSRADAGKCRRLRGGFFAGLESVVRSN
jgi:hypothetical protein